MIKQFEVKGFKNFKEKITLDFTKVRDYKFNTNCIADNLIRKAIIYGKNSIGKSNFGLALFDIVSHLSINHKPTDLYEYFLNAEDNTKYAEFHYIFNFDKDIIDYTYRKDENLNLLYEKININNKLLYEYDYETKLGDTSGIREVAPTLNLSFQEIDCILRYLITNTVLDDSEPLKKLSNFVNNMLWFRNLDDNRYIGTKTKADDYLSFIFEDKVLKEFEDFLHESGVEENLIVKTEVDGKKKLYIDTKTPLPFFKVASNGTRALYTFFYWYKTTAPSFLFLDEFDAFYHYELSETIVRMVDKFKNSQVIFTSHNTNLLTNRIMRPDCFFIMTKDKLTSFAGATDRELREGHNLEKLYMSGEFDGE